MRNYHDTQFVFDMEISDFLSQYNKIKERELEQRTWELWLVKYPYMTENTFVSFEDMLNIAKQKEAHPQDANKVTHGVYIDQIFI